MGSTASLLLLVAAIVAAVGSLGVWLALRRPARALQRRQRDEALAAAARYTPAERAPTYGPPPDPCAPGLSDSERVAAMRALLLRGDRRAAEADAPMPYEATEPMNLRDAEMSTSPMAWRPTVPLDEADEPGRTPGSRRQPARGADHEHITV